MYHHCSEVVEASSSALRNLHMKSYLVICSILVGWMVSPADLVAQDARGSGLSGTTATGVGLDSLTASGTLDVYLKASNGAPIKNATVTLLQDSGQAYKQVTISGDFVHFNEIAAPIEFHVRVVAPGFEPAILKVATKPKYSAKLVFELQPASADNAAFAARLATLSPKAQNQLGKAMEALRGNDPAKARHPLDALQAVAPNHPEVNYLLGVYASKTRDDEHAKSYWARALELDPKHLQAMISLAELDIREKNLDEALLLARRAVETNASSWRAHAVLANACSKTGDYGEALQQAERALELGHAQATVVEPRLASLLDYTGDKKRAVELLRSYLAEHPADDAAKRQLARIEKGESAATPEFDDSDDSAVANAATAILPASNWLPPDVDEKMPPVESGGDGCNAAEVLQGAGKRVEEFVHNVDRFTATESLFHESINKWGAPTSRESRNFEYVAAITELHSGIFLMDEYRQFDGHPAEFPNGVATLGLPALALIFHAHNSENYDMVCEGLTRWDGNPVWQLHFRQKPGKPNTMRAYRLSLRGPSYPVALRGRAWIAADSYQLVRLETDLVAPHPEIKLLADHIIIEYGPVHFHDAGTELWLPHSAEVFFDWNSVRMHRRHTFSDYLLFSTDATQKISEPKFKAKPEPESEPQPTSQTAAVPHDGRP
jgi:Flp pilus assembly protein TadD